MIDDAADATCPACGGSTWVTGTLDARAAMRFQPAALRFWNIGPISAPIVRAPRLPGLGGRLGARGLQACVDCGLVWSHVDPARLREIIARRGKPELRAVLEPLAEPARSRSGD